MVYLWRWLVREVLLYLWRAIFLNVMSVIPKDKWVCNLNAKFTDCVCLGKELLFLKRWSPNLALAPCICIYRLHIWTHELTSGQLLLAYHAWSLKNDAILSIVYSIWENIYMHVYLRGVHSICICALNEICAKSLTHDCDNVFEFGGSSERVGTLRM